MIHAGNTEEEVIFAGLDPGSDMPYTVTITALDSSNAPIEVIERRVRLGKYLRCALCNCNTLVWLLNTKS